MNVIMEFASPIGMFDADPLLSKTTYDDILKVINNPNEEIFSYIGISKTTPDDLYTRQEFKDILSFINEKTKLFAEEVLGIKMNDLKISGMWSNIHNSGSKHHYHQHPNSFISGVFYPFCPDCEDIGNIVFVDPRQAKNMVYADFVKSSCISNRNIWITPRTGLLVLFPSWLEHGTDTFISKLGHSRVSLSFNFQLKNCSYKTMRINE